MAIGKEVGYTIILFVALLLGMQCLQAQNIKPVLNARVEESWTVEKARREAFNGLLQHVDLSGFAAKDPDWSGSIYAISNRLNIHNGKKYTHINTGYIIEQGNIPGLQYNLAGKLYFVTFFTPDKNKKAIYEYPSGNLAMVSIKTPEKTFKYDAKGQYLGYFKNNLNYDANNNIIGSINHTENAGIMNWDVKILSPEETKEFYEKQDK